MFPRSRFLRKPRLWWRGQRNSKISKKSLSWRKACFTSSLPTSRGRMKISSLSWRERSLD
ncbi:hypothetical protein Pint_16040 [Pistacia integerrima]|uniref:Uncharacterized protein n=1 Tax=Pistacia integerrima TaxID=434235 RepID=A0ACC0ZBI2_9ROSI|nr:hypothetical protein Pint_16040 [Pistacia integerrima]